MTAIRNQKIETLQAVWIRLLAVHKAQNTSKAQTSFCVVDQTIVCSPFTLKKQLRIPLHISFTRVTIKGALDVHGCLFEEGATFVDVDFESKADFSHCVFEGQAYFWKCRFWETANFESVRVTDKPIEGTERYAGETNFSYSEFSKSADFKRIDVKGPTWFHRTIFKQNVHFDTAHFAKRFIIDGIANDVCVAEREFYNEMASILLKNGVLLHCSDHKGYYNFNPSLGSTKQALESLGVSTQDADLIKSLLTADSSEDSHNILYAEQKYGGELIAVARLWSQHFEAPTLSPTADCSFRGVVFGEESEFRHLHMDRCYLEGASVSNIDFVGVRWIRMLFRTWTGSRQITYDEFMHWQKVKPAVDVELKSMLRYIKRLVNTPKKWLPIAVFRYKRARAVLRNRWQGELANLIVGRSKEPILDVQAEVRSGRPEYGDQLDNNLSDLYHRLRVRHEQKGDRESARDFYYGELEMLRVAKPLIPRTLSLANVYRLSSGYGKLEGLALTWLLLFVFVMFPILFGTTRVIIDCKFRDLQFFSKVIRSELASLEASTFLNHSRLARSSATELSHDDLMTEEKTDRYVRVIEGFERIVIPIQAGLFLLAVKTRFKGPG